MILSKPQHNDFQALTKWLLPCIKGFAPVFGEFKDNAVTVMPDTSAVLQEYLDGTKKFSKTYAIQCYFSVADSFKIFEESDIENSENITEYELAQSVNEWIERQNEVENFPEVDGWQTVSIAPTSKMPNFDGISESDDVTLARYTIFVTVIYRD